ncbi:MAG: hypothetical protein J3K34DRAFT_516181 [Monoraphidium minutum]|nr:MAG: hypothetical protein J3K34DRAFT_516181 [Monoraphidium minutum]
MNHTRSKACAAALLAALLLAAAAGAAGAAPASRPFDTRQWRGGPRRLQQAPPAGGFLLGAADDRPGGRFEGGGSPGDVFRGILRAINANADAVPRIGSIATADAAAAGASSAERPRAITALEETPLRTGGVGTAGGAAVDPDRAAATMSSSATAAAKRIISDDGGKSRNLGAGGLVEGFTLAESPDTPNDAGVQSLGGTGSDAGERAIVNQFGIPFGQALIVIQGGGRRDGGDNEAAAQLTGIGDRVSSRARVASLGVTSPGAPDNDDGRDEEDDISPASAAGANAGGAFVRGAADAVDTPGFSSTRERQNPAPPPQNTRLELSSRGAATRYGGTRGLVQGSAEVYGSEAARAQITNGVFGTELATLSSTTRSVTFRPSALAPAAFLGPGSAIVLGRPDEDPDGDTPLVIPGAGVDVDIDVGADGAGVGGAGDGPAAPGVGVGGAGVGGVGGAGVGPVEPGVGVGGAGIGGADTGVGGVDGAGAALAVAPGTGGGIGGAGAGA